MSVTEPPAAEPQHPENTVVDVVEPGGRRRLLVGLAGGGVAAAVALGAAGAWAWSTYGGGGDRPADVLPASTFGYVAVDLDPAAGQKLEAVTTLRKFPALKDAGVSEDADLAKTLGDKLAADGSCANFDFGRVVSPWLGKRAAVAAVTLGDKAVPVGVVQVRDEKAADAGLLALRACSENGDARSTKGVERSWVVRDGWAYVAADTATATQVADAAAKSTLGADSSAYRTWTDRVGDQGVLSAYVAPKVGPQLKKLVTALDPGSSADAAGIEGVLSSYDDYPGGAMTLRFADGGLELETVGGLDDSTKAFTAAGAGKAVSSLPADTLVAVGTGLQKGWATTTMDSLQKQAGTAGLGDLFGEIEQSTGLSMPGDLETLLGRTMVLSVGADLDVAAMDSIESPDQVPVAVKVLGDQAAIEGVLDKLRSAVPEAEQLIGSTKVGSDGVVVGPSSTYREAVAKGGDLGSDDTFRSVVPNADRAVVAAYVDLDGKNDWFATLAGQDPEVKRNLEPLSAIGMSAWVDGDVLHSRVRIATD